ncbi:unnamed protein product [Nezara viridula]|uniref:Uncharacterized protein n=1 Tax=Nezara viridula TaxID=85310 RepID=A0A9P0MRE4_NEZVI|nr:unnamed protein product [Nezara viridula]
MSGRGEARASSANPFLAWHDQNDSCRGRGMPPAAQQQQQKVLQQQLDIQQQAAHQSTQHRLGFVPPPPPRNIPEWELELLEPWNGDRSVRVLYSGMSSCERISSQHYYTRPTNYSVRLPPGAETAGVPQDNILGSILTAHILQPTLITHHHACH